MFVFTCVRWGVSDIRTFLDMFFKYNNESKIKYSAVLMYILLYNIKILLLHSSTSIQRRQWTKNTIIIPSYHFSYFANSAWLYACHVIGWSSTLSKIMVKFIFHTTNFKSSQIIIYSDIGYMLNSRLFCTTRLINLLHHRVSWKCARLHLVSHRMLFEKKSV